MLRKVHGYSAGIVFCLAIFWFSGLGYGQADKVTLPDKFLFGASVYPELMTRDQWLGMLDEFTKANFDVVRIGESSWGNLEVADGKFDFGWLRTCLDDLHKRNIKAILGTSTYIAPQWLCAKHPEILVQKAPGRPVHPMARKAASLTAPAYRQACRKYILAIGKEFKDHPAVIGWQLDNEIESWLEGLDYNPANVKAWHEWLKKTYHTPAELNERLMLVGWGMKVESFEQIPLPTDVIEGADATHLRALSLAYLHFRRDVTLEFFIEQTKTLREAGVRQWITTDWNDRWIAVADDPMAKESLDIAGLNFYQWVKENPDYWKKLAWQFDMHRSAHRLGKFLATETTIGTIGDAAMRQPYPVHDQFKMWDIQATAYGACLLMYWSANRWRGSHWPCWGGLLDWSGKPEPDFAWVIEMGEFYKKWGDTLLKNPVKADAVVLTDFDQREALDIYKHTPASQTILPDSFDALHRLGIGVDTMNGKDAQRVENMKKYSLVVIPAVTALDGSAIPKALKEYAEGGGHILVTPFTAYQDWDGIFRGDGFGANLSEVTGVLVRTVRRMGTSVEIEGRKDPYVAWKSGDVNAVSPVGVDGFCELMEVSPETEVIATFQSEEPILNGRPAATEKRIGKGSVIKLAFWPRDDSVLRLVHRFIPDVNNLLAEAVPAGVQAVPRTDGSMFIINTSIKPAAIKLKRTAPDRISGAKLTNDVRMGPYGVLWVE